MNPRIAAMERLVAQDPAQRGIANLVQWGSLERAAALLLQARPAGAAQSVGIISGFYLPVPRVGETDGPPGAKAMGLALEALGARVHYLTDAVNAPLFRALGLTSVYAWAADAEWLDALQLTHVISTERPGRAQDGRYYTMAARDITADTPPLDDVFIEARRRGLPTLAIGDGGNEIGMGKVLERVRQDVRNGPTIGCVVDCDELIVAGVSNWGAYALAAALQVLSGRALLLSPEQAGRDIHAVVAAGAADGHTFRNEATVDGQPLADNVRIVAQLHALCAAPLPA